MGWIGLFTAGVTAVIIGGNVVLRPRRTWQVCKVVIALCIAFTLTVLYWGAVWFIGSGNHTDSEPAVGWLWIGCVAYVGWRTFSTIRRTIAAIKLGITQRYYAEREKELTRQLEQTVNNIITGPPESSAKVAPLNTDADLKKLHSVSYWLRRWIKRVLGLGGRGPICHDL